MTQQVTEQQARDYVIRHAEECGTRAVILSVGPSEEVEGGWAVDFRFENETACYVFAVWWDEGYEAIYGEY